MIPKDHQRALYGEETLRRLHKLIQTAKIHEDSNQLLIKCIDDFSEVLRHWWREDEVLTIKLARGRFLIQDEKLTYQRENVNFIEEMYRFFERRGLAGLRFHADETGFSPETILRFTHLISEAGEKEDPLSWILKGLAESDYSWVEILQLPQAEANEDDSERKDLARRTYAHALVSVKEVSEKLNSQRQAGVRKLKRITQNMVDMLLEDEAIMLGISTIRDYDDYTYTHSVNVAILSLCLGRRIGLRRTELSHLAICGLLHDLGKLSVPREILNKPGKLTEHEFKEIEKHPLESASQIMRMKAPEDLMARILLPPFEHHLKYDLSGYPRVQHKRSVSLFGKIIAIADVFDALTSPRIYRPKAISPNHALGIMLEKAGTDFDPVLLKVFIHMLGAYPVGTLVKLDTGELGLVADCEPNGDPTRPKVVLISSDGAGNFKKGKTVRLSDRNPETGAFKKSIVGSCHPSSVGLQPADFIL